jgi:hypothetical protein
MRNIVYIVRESDAMNPQLRYSLRSLSNLREEVDVVIVGYLPRWVKNVIHVPTEQNKDKWCNAANNIIAACECEYLSDDIILMNDDFFFVAPVQRVYNFFFPIDKQIKMYLNTFGENNRYAARLVDTRDFLLRQGLPRKNIVSYELHLPLVISRGGYLDAARLVGEDGMGHPSMRTVYGNLFKSDEDVKAPQDVKIRRFTDHLPGGAFASTTKQVFLRGIVGREIRELFPDRSIFEKEEA